MLLVNCHSSEVADSRLLWSQERLDALGLRQKVFLEAPPDGGHRTSLAVGAFKADSLQAAGIRRVANQHGFTVVKPESLKLNGLIPDSFMSVQLKLWERAQLVASRIGHEFELPGNSMVRFIETWHEAPLTLVHIGVHLEGQILENDAGERVYRTHMWLVSFPLGQAEAAKNFVPKLDGAALSGRISHEPGEVFSEPLPDGFTLWENTPRKRQ